MYLTGRLYGKLVRCDSSKSILFFYEIMYSADSTDLVVVSSVFLPLASVFVALRFTVRKSTKAGIGLDDYAILLALVSYS